MMERRDYTIETNGIEMHVAEMGAGPLVLLCHGFPELGYSWRHQLPALAEAGFRVVAPDQRGYGRTERPEPIEAYDIFQLTGDMVGLVHALGEDEAVIAGHDWGSMVAWHCTLFRPDMFRALALLSVPYTPRPWEGPSPTELMKRMSGRDTFYIVYFQEPGRAEKDLEADVRKSMVGMLSGLSGNPSREERLKFFFIKSGGMAGASDLPETLPAWLTEADVAVYTRTFEQTGFRGGLNWYRNMDRNWAMTPFLSGARILQPTLFIAGRADPVVDMTRASIEGMETQVPNLKSKVLLPGAGHWVQQELPDQVNDLLLGFLKGL